MKEGSQTFKTEISGNQMEAAVKNKDENNESVMRLKPLIKSFQDADINKISDENNFHLLHSLLKTGQP